VLTARTQQPAHLPICHVSEMPPTAVQSWSAESKRPTQRRSARHPRQQAVGSPTALLPAVPQPPTGGGTTQKGPATARGPQRRELVVCRTSLRSHPRGRPRPVPSTWKYPNHKKHTTYGKQPPAETAPTNVHFNPPALIRDSRRVGATAVGGAGARPPATARTRATVAATRRRVPPARRGGRNRRRGGPERGRRAHGGGRRCSRRRRE